MLDTALLAIERVAGRRLDTNSFSIWKTARVWRRSVYDTAKMMDLVNDNSDQTTDNEQLLLVRGNICCCELLLQRTLICGYCHSNVTHSFGCHASGYLHL